MAATRDVAGRRYALAIVEIARADDSLDSWLEAGEALEALTSEGAFVAALQSDGMTDDGFATIVRRVMPDATEKQLNLFRLLRRKGRLSLGPSIASFLREIADEERGILRAVVTTAIELDDERREQVRQRIIQSSGRQQVEIETRVDPSILGGIVIRIGDQMVDGSTRSRLHQLRSSLERAAS
ncbi:MAG: ATP synthase F1 subunit delta [Chloroflexi bacterium]|nr:ATP synthase F1 subunit delta [Chloroflexota bacterium]